MYSSFVLKPGEIRDMNRQVVIGIDPGLANLGWCVMEIGVTSETPLTLGVFSTEKSVKKTNVLASDDDTRRCRELARALDALCEEWRPWALCVEAASWPRNAGAAAKTGMSRGIIATIAEQRQIPILQESPQGVKKAVCGKRDASKQEVEAAVCAKYPQALQIATAAKFRKADREHAFDSVAAVVACLRSDLMVLARMHR